MTADLQEQLLLRARSPVAADLIVSADEVADWPKGALAALIQDGVLGQIEPATTVACDDCFEGHVEEVQFIEEPPGSALRAYIPCPEAGRVAVDTERMLRWQIRREEADHPEEQGRPTHDAGASGPSFRHSDDYTSAVFNGRDFQFTPRRAAVIRRLHEAHINGAPDVPWRSIKQVLEGLGSYPQSMADVLKGVEGWEELIVSPKRGFWRLAL